MNTQSIEKSMNGLTSLSDGEITINEGSIIFSDGSGLDSSDDIAFKSLDNVMTGNNTFDNAIIAPTTPSLGTHLTNKSYVDTVIQIETTGLLAKNNTFTAFNTFNQNVSVITGAPINDNHLTRKDYVDSEIATETTDFLTRDNTFSGINTFSNTTSSTNSTTGAVIVGGGVGVGGYINSNSGFVVNTTAFPNNWYNGIFKGTTDGATATDYNLAVKSWQGIGFVHNDTGSNPSQTASIYMDVRTGTITGNNLNSSGITNVGAITNTGTITNTGNLSNSGTINNMYIFKKVNGFVISDTQHLATTGEHNNSLGVGANENVSTGRFNNAFGNNSMFSNMTGSYNTAYGQASGGINQTGSYNTYIGYGTKVNLSGYSQSTALGCFAAITDNYQCVLGATTTTSYVKIPSTKSSSEYTNGALVVDGGVGVAGNLRVNGRCIFSDILAVDKPASFGNTVNITGYMLAYAGANIQLTTTLATAEITTLNVSGTTTTEELITDNINGVRISGSDNAAGQTSIIIDTGSETIGNLISSTENNFIVGKNNLSAYQSGTQNITLGLQNLQNITTQSYNTAVGCNVFRDANTSGFNTGIGNSVFKLTTTGGYNVGMGFEVGISNTSGSNNVMIGYRSGEFSNGNNNVFLGNSTKTNNLGTYTNSTAIGQSATITASNQMVLGTAGDTLSVVIPSTNYTALAVGGGATFGREVRFSSKTYTEGMIQMAKNINYKKLVLYQSDSAVNDDPITATTFYGFGMDSGTLRYQTDATTSIHKFYCGGTLNMEVGGDKVKINSTTDGATNAGALVVSGGAYVAKHIQLPATGAGIRLGDGNKGICYSNQNSLKTGADAQYYNIDDGIAVYGWTDGCLGTRGGGDKQILYWRNSGRVGINNKSPTTSLDVAGNGKISTELYVGQTLLLNDKILYFKASSGTSKVLKEALYMWSFSASNNTTYSLNLGTQGLSNYLGYPFEIRVMFYPTNNTYPVYNITNQAFIYNYDVGYQVAYTDSNTMKLRTGDMFVAICYNHTTLSYQTFTSGTYAVYIYP